MKNKNKKRWMFYWRGGGFNDVHGDTLEEAYTEAVKFGAEGLGRTLVPAKGSFKEWTVELSDELCRAYPID